MTILTTELKNDERLERYKFVAPEQATIDEGLKAFGLDSTSLLTFETCL